MFPISDGLNTMNKDIKKENMHRETDTSANLNYTCVQIHQEAT